METEKIYYAAIILICAASMLLSPFFYISKGRINAPRPTRWRPIAAANLIMLAAMLFIWWKWF